MRHIRHPKQSPTYQCSAHVMHCLTHYQQDVSLRAAWNYTILAHVTLHCIMHTIRPMTHTIIGLIENAKKRGNLAAATANLPARSQACVAWSKVSSLESRQPPAKHLRICSVLTNPHASICLAGNLHHLHHIRLPHTNRKQSVFPGEEPPRKVWMRRAVMQADADRSPCTLEMQIGLHHCTDVIEVF